MFQKIVVDFRLEGVDAKNSVIVFPGHIERKEDFQIWDLPQVVSGLLQKYLESFKSEQVTAADKQVEELKKALEKQEQKYDALQNKLAEVTVVKQVAELKFDEAKFNAAEESHKRRSRRPTED